MIKPTDFSFFLDSGAFSAWSKGTQIDIDEYCEFIRANCEQIEVYASLDCIPGTLGKIATTAERNEAAEKSWKNYLYMVRSGLSPLPVYHYGEDPRYLQRMLDHGCDYIGIGGLVGVPGPKRRLWLDALFERLVDAEGHPIVKTHGFGMTSVPLIFRYPWYSVDSTSWIKATANGAIYLPATDDAGAFVFDRTPMTVAVSAASPKIAGDSTHYLNLPQVIQQLVQRWVQECGKTMEGVAESYRHRATCNVTFFRRVSEAKIERPYKPEKKAKPVNLFTS
jgi:hypothetical protein